MDIVHFTQDSPMMKSSEDALNEDALNYHQLDGIPGKTCVMPTKPLETQHDLSLAYTPGVAVPVQEIEKDPKNVYKYTNKLYVRSFCEGERN